ncbi:MAG TPA: hypothetical protein VFX45_06755 [Solirubrobacterales bacterium]|nr:hypothetical protein [Solirubrobacterales bacterium]
MDDSGLRQRLESLAPPDLVDARERAKLAARVSMSRRPAVATGPRLLRPRNLSFAGGLAALAAALVLALGTGGGSGLKAEPASAADLTRLADVSPHLQVVGGWQITNTEVTPEGGATRFHFERSEEFGESDDIEIRWFTDAAVEEVGRQLEAEGFEAAGAVPVNTTDGVKKRFNEYESITTASTGHAYVSQAGGPLPETVGVWHQDGLTFALRSHLESIYMLERRLERVEFLGPEEWLIAIRPGGGMWLNESSNGSVRKVEKEKVELPDGTFTYQTTYIAKSPEELAELDFTAPYPLISRDGDTVKVEVQKAPNLD